MRRIFRTLIFSTLPLLVVPLFADPHSVLRGHVIVVDAGHGVIDYDSHIINPGKVNTSGVMEHKLNMSIAQKLGARLEKEGAKVIYTRTPYDYWRESYGTIEDNKNRAEFANEIKAEVFLAIHCDWHPKRKVQGVTTIYKKPESKKLGEAIHRQMLKKLRARDRKLVNDSYTVLDVINMPGLIIECGFMSHREESRKLVKPAYQNDIAEAITNGLKAYFSSRS
jgi:N-acetylmuramoyl-L-alanine amidase